ncbi:MAG: hypothetical protein AAB459_04555 [Patescibacteria group bacterium]
MIKTKIRQLFSLQRLLALVGLVILFVLSVQGSLFSQAATQGYGTDEPLQRGMIIQINKKDPTKVQPVSVDSGDQMHGLIVDPNDAALTLSSEGEKVFVATHGIYEVLVSDQNGAIDAGDWVTISSLNGIGAKATTKSEFVIGRALSSFDGKSSIISQSEVKDSNDVTHKVDISRVKLDIGVGKNPIFKVTEANLPSFLKKAAESIAGRPVTTQRIYVSLAVFVVSAIISGSLLYSGVRSGLISIGRNPLSKKSIIRSMVQVILTAIIIFITGLFGVYLLLKL